MLGDTGLGQTSPVMGPGGGHPAQATHPAGADTHRAAMLPHRGGRFPGCLPGGTGAVIAVTCPWPRPGCCGVGAWRSPPPPELCCSLLPRVPKEKPKAEAAPKPRQGPTDEAQMAAAAALARMELKPKTKVSSSQEAIKNQGRCSLEDAELLHWRRDGGAGWDGHSSELRPGRDIPGGRLLGCRRHGGHGHLWTRNRAPG